MPILYCVIARGSTILAKFGNTNGNFDDVVLEVLKKKPEENTKHSYQYVENVINCIIENNVSYICITNLDFDRNFSFQYLDLMKNKFKTKYGMLIQTALPYSMNSEYSKIMSSDMAYFNNGNRKIADIETSIDSLTNVMKSNLDKAIQRGENMENMASQSENLYDNAVQFNRASTRVRRQMWCKNVKTTVFIVIGVVIILSIVIGLLVWKFQDKK